MYRSLLRVSILMIAIFAASASRANDTPFIVADAETGAVLAQNLPNHRWHPASLTKLMTAYVTFRAIEAEEIAAGSPVQITNAAARQPSSRMGYAKGTILRVDTALKIIIIKSANDVSYALAEAVGGSVPQFVNRMNLEAQRLGLSNTKFTNSNGLHNKNQYTSARDMAVLSSRILTEFPQFAYMFSAVGIKTAARTHYSYNLLLERFPGTTGMKTGFVCASGYNMVASAKTNGRHLLAVVLGRSSQTDRAVAAAKLITEYAQNQAIGSLYNAVSSGADPKNMRPVLCTEQARANRYDPVSGTAVIKSRYLQPSSKNGVVLTVFTGGADAPPGNAWITRNLVVKGVPPVPSKRPNYDPALGKIVLAAIGEAATGLIAIPTPSPR